MRILLVEDDPGIASFIVKGLKEAGYIVEYVADGPAGLDELLAEEFDAAIIDIMLPLQDGLSVIQTARQQNVTTPVLILSAKASVDDRVVGLQNGGDDYLVKPFAFSELLARLQALIRRANRITEPTTLTVGPLIVDLIRRKVKRSDQEIELQPLEFSLLEYLSCQGFAGAETHLGKGSHIVAHRCLYRQSLPIGLVEEQDAVVRHGEGVHCCPQHQLHALIFVPSFYQAGRGFH